MPATNMNHFTVLTDDVETTVRFYGDLLGLRAGPRPNERRFRFSRGAGHRADHHYQTDFCR